MRKTIITIAAMLLLLSLPAELAAQIPDKESQMSQAESLLERRRWGQARVALDRLVDELDPVKDKQEVEWVEYQKVRCAVELGLDNAVEVMESYIKSYPSSLHRNSVAFMIACYECDKGDIFASGELFDRVDYKALSNSERERYNIRVGYLNFLKGDYSVAHHHFQQVSPVSEYYPHAIYYISYIAYQEGNNVLAERGFKELTKYAMYSELVPYYLLQLEYRKANYDYVITEGEKLINSASSETYADLVRIIAESYFVKSDYADAIRYMANYPEERMDRQDNYIKGYSLYRLARYHDAIAPLSKVCGADDALTQNASYHLGDCYLKVGDKPHAADAFAMAAADGFDGEIAEDALLNYGRLKYELGGGLFNEAINVLQSYLERYPQSAYVAEVKRLLVAAFYNSADYDAAYAAIKNLKNPDNDLRAVLQRVAVFRAVAAIGRGEWSVAEELLKESESIGLVSKYNALTLYWQGEVAYHNGDMAKALQCYEDYIRRAPRGEMEYNYAHYGAGYAYLNSGRFVEAQSAFQTFVRNYNMRDDYLYDAHNRLGDAYFAAREFKDARKAYNVVGNAAVEQRHYARYQMAIVDGIEDKQSSKIDRLKGIVSDGVGDYVDDAWYELGRTFIAAQRYREGAETLKEFVTKDSLSPYHTSALSDLALAYYNLGRKGDARLCYERVVSYDPQSPEAMEAIRGIREIYLSQGKVDEYFAYAERNGLQSDMSAAARDSLTFAAAKNIYLNGDMKEASHKLKNYIESFANGYNKTEALFLLSDCYVAEEQNEEALVTMKQLLDHGTTQYTERVLDLYARMNYDMARYNAAAEAYRSLYDLSHDSKRRAVTAESYVDATLRYADGDAVKRMADDVLSMADATDWAVRQSSLAKANVLLKEGRRQDALDIYVVLAENRKMVEGAEAYFRIVENDYLVGNYDLAEQRVYELGECGSMYWQAKIFLVLGDVLVKRGNTFQARATYQSIVDGYTPADDGIVDEAKERIASLAK